MSADPTFVWKFVGIPKRSETGLKPSETVGKQLYPLILHLYGNLWTSSDPVLVRTTKCYSSTTLYYKALL